MLAILMEDQILEPHVVCQSCLLADRGGQPRWKGGQLRCGRAVSKRNDNQPDQYDCQMGFRIANIK
jgi:hypothetical protein